MSVYLGDLIDGGTHDFKFTTTDAGGIPFTLAGTPALSVYKDNSITQTTTGPTITADFDGLTGVNHVRLVLTDAFYVADTDYTVVITTGTVDGNSVVGYVVANFSISNRMPNVNVVQWLDTACATPTVAGVPEVDVTHIVGGAIPAPAVTGVPDVNVTHIVDGIIPAPAVTGVPDVNVTHIVDGLVPPPATTGIPDVNVLQWLDTAVATPTVAGVPEVDITHLGGTTTITLPGQVAPPLSPNISEALGWLYKVLRNRKDQTSTLWQLYADNQTTVDSTATVSDDGTTAIKQEIVSGP